MTDPVQQELRLAILDDDPTGTQCVAGVPVVTSWSVADLRWALTRPSPAFFVLTNSRALPPDRAAAVNAEIATNLATAARELGVEVGLVSRGDSTLRGHFPLETDVLAATWARERGRPVDAVVVCPAFLSAGRITRDDVHLVVADGVATPVGDTPYARDATFGFRNSNLREWVAERHAATPGARPTRVEDVASISLADIRDGGPRHVAEIIGGLRDARPVVVNATTEADLDVVALGVQAAQEAGSTVLVRSGPSFVRALAGLPVPAPLAPGDIPDPGGATAAGGLVVVGSHVPLTTRQAAQAEALGGFTRVELDPCALLDDPGGEPARVRAAVGAALATGDVLLQTSRTLLTGVDGADSLRIAGLVADALVGVVDGVLADRPPRFLVAKGGITSSDVLTRALRLRRGWVLGQMLSGLVPVWAVDAAEPGPATPPYVIFPGNVGDDGTLAHVVTVLRAATSPKLPLVNRSTNLLPSSHSSVTTP